jgi:hypothetical protein
MSSPASAPEQHDRAGLAQPARQPGRSRPRAQPPGRAAPHRSRARRRPP